MTKFMPSRVISAQLDDERKVSLYYDGERFGILCRNSETITRSLFTAEAMEALVQGYHALSAGGGDEVKYEWVAIETNTFAREPLP